MAAVGSSTTIVATTLSLMFLGIVEGAYVQILQQNQDIDPVDGSYRYSYGTANGIVVAEEGRVKYVGPETVEKTVDGSYAYLHDDGTLVHVKYVADGQGYRAVPSVVYRPQARRGLSGGVNFPNYESLRQALRL